MGNGEYIEWGNGKMGESGKAVKGAFAFANNALGQ